MVIVYALFLIQGCGHADAHVLSGDQLRLNLFNKINDHKSVAYGQLWNEFPLTDVLTDTSNVAWDIYSYSPQELAYKFYYKKDQCGKYSKEGDCYNREHSFPKSWWGGKIGSQYTDLFHIYPTDAYVNNIRANYPYGEVSLQNTKFVSKNGSKLGSSNNKCYSGTVFEPIDEFKGDLARSYFYMVTRYMPDIKNWSENYNSPMLEDNNLSKCAQKILIKWHLEDPVSNKEIERNKNIQKIQGNYNPYIRNPSLVCKVWKDNALCEKS